MTAKIEEVDRLIGLKLGADDYICKPYSPREVVARVEAVLRRSVLAKNISDQNKVGSLKDINTELRSLRIDEERLAALFDEKSVILTLVEFNILKTLLSRPNRIFSRDELMDSAYSDHRVVNVIIFDSHITKLRKKILNITGIETIYSVYGVGYKYEGL